MKKRVFDYVKENPGSSVHDIAIALRAKENLVLRIVNDLVKDGFMSIIPVPLSDDNDCSCYYKVIKQEYKELDRFYKERFTKMRKDENYFYIKSILDKIEKEDIESFYQSIKNSKPSNGSSTYSALTNDLIGCCPSAQQWNNPRNRELFKQDVLYYCDYYLSFYNAETD